MSNSGYIIPVNPADLANRLCGPDPNIERLENGPTEEEPEGDFGLNEENFREKIMPALDLIPEREADLIYMYFVLKKKQADIASIFGVTQAAVSYRLSRGIERIKFVISMPKITQDDLERDLPKIFQKVDVDILIGMWLTTCQSEVASKLKLTQGRVRHRFLKAVKKLSEHMEVEKQFENYHRFFAMIVGKKYNILREVKLPQWSNRGNDQCL
jgi:predicted XRE-type DNA-binding protein